MKILTFVVTGPGHRHRRALNFPFSYLLLLAAASFRFFFYCAILSNVGNSYFFLAVLALFVISLPPLFSRIK